MQKIILAASLLLAVASAAPTSSHARYVLVDCKSSNGHQWSQIEYWARPAGAPKSTPTEVGKFDKKVTWEGQANSVFTKTQQLISDINAKPVGDDVGNLAFSDNHGGPLARVLCTKDTRGKSSHYGSCTSKYICEY